MPRQIMKWDEGVHEDILLAVFNQVNFTSEQIAGIMNELRARGYSFTESALRFTLSTLIMSRALSTHKWDEHSHFGLLLAMIDVAKPSKDVLVQVAEHMQSQGFTTTFNGVNQHIQKLRRTQDSPEKNTKNGSVPATPTKATPKRKTRAPKAKPSKFDDVDDQISVKEEQYYDDDQDEPVAKRVKQDAE